MSEKIKGVKLYFKIKEIKKLETLLSNVIFIKGGFKKASKFEKDLWHTLKDICEDTNEISIKKLH